MFIHLMAALGVEMHRRVAAYSHDTVGLGHLRRTLSICRHLTDRDADLSALVITGSPFTQAFGSHERIDYLKVPSARKLSNGHYESRYLDMKFDSLKRLRSRVIAESIRAFNPQVLLVDKTAAGMGGELRACLKSLRKASGRTRVILGLRDILDEPISQRREWCANGEMGVIADYYDAVWIYGSPDIFDAVKEYRFPDSVARMTTYVGYLPKYNGGRPAEQLREELQAGTRPLIVVSAGGGEDGYRLLRLYMDAIQQKLIPSDFLSVLVTGPGMPRARVADLREGADDGLCRIIEFTDHFISLLSAADLVVTMGGYNTLTEAACLGRRIVAIPRITPRKEQWIRARCFEERGLLTMVEPEGITPRALWSAMRHELDRPAARQIPRALPFTGLEHLTMEFDKHVLATGHSLVHAAGGHQ